MGKLTNGEKPKFDLITASKTKKYKIITAVVLVLGVLILGISLIMKSMVTSAVVPNTLAINHLSNLQGNECTISQAEISKSFVLSTGTTEGRALVDPIVFTLLDGADAFMEVRDATDTKVINSAYYSGMFYLHVRDDAPAYVKNTAGDLVRPTGTLRITCGSFLLQIQFTYYAA